MTDEVRSYCRICAASCGIVVHLDGDRVVSVRGDPDHPVSRGYTCAKGRALPALHHHERRLNQPSRADTSSDTHTDGSWDLVLDDLAARLRAVIDEHGANAVGAYIGTGLAYDTAGFVAATGWLAAIGSQRLYTPATVDNAPVLLAAELVAGHPQANPVCDFERARCVLIIGSNPVVSHGYGTALPDPISHLRRMHRRGATTWVLDPLRTETAAIADRHLAVRPGSDAIVLAWLVRERLAAPLSPAARAATDAPARARLALALQPFSLARAATAACIDDTDLLALRDAVLAADGALAAWCGTGVTMGRDGLVAEWLRWALLALSGSLDTVDGMRFHRGLAFPLRRPRRPKRPRSEFVGPASRPELRHWIGQDPCVTLADEIDAGNVRALVVAGANPITAFPEPDATRRALASLDTLTVIDVTEHELTDIATHVLPASGQLERCDIPMHELVSIRGGTCYSPAVVPRSHDRRAAWWIFAQLTRRMTAQELFGADPDALTDDDVLALLASRSRVSFDAVRTAGPHGITVEPDVGWVRTELLDGGPWQIAPVAFVARLRSIEDPHAGLVLVPRRRARANNSVPDPGASDPSASDPSPADASPGAPTAVARESLLLVNPLDATASGFADGDTVVISSAHGAVVTTARVDERVSRGVVSMSHGDPIACAGTLVSAHAEIDPLTGMPCASGIAVTLTLSPGSSTD